jgi:hypothetical protein
MLYNSGMKTICQMQLPGGLDIDLMFDKGKLAYVFTFEEKTYGNAVKLPSRKVSDVAAVSLALFTNALETFEALKNKTNES